MDKIILTRKGESEGNIKNVYQGRSFNSHLTERGKNQSKLLAQVLQKDYSLDVIFTSPLIRAQETAEIIAEYIDAPIEPMEELTEMDFGSLEGKSTSQVRAIFPEVLKTWRKQPSEAQMPGGEKFTQVLKRAEEAVEKIKTDERKSGLIVSHDALLRAMMTILLDKDPDNIWKFELFNCSITEIDLSADPPRVTVSNESDHLTSYMTDRFQEAL